MSKNQPTAAPTVHGPLHGAYLAAVEAAKAAEQAWADDDTATQDDLTHPARVATDAADAARDAAREAWLASDEPREFDLCEEGNWYETIVADSLSDALEIAESNVDRANYDDDGDPSTLRIEVRAKCVETGEDERATVTIEVEAPECTEAEHDWCSPYSVVGGIEENPGVWGHGGGIISTEACSHCGAYRKTDTWATDRSNGERFEEVTYTEADGASRKWVESRRPDPDACDEDALDRATQECR